MDKGTEETEAVEPEPTTRGWLMATIFMLGLGSLGPANVYYALTDPRYFDRFSGWRILLLPLD